MGWETLLNSPWCPRNVTRDILSLVGKGLVYKGHIGTITFTMAFVGLVKPIHEYPEYRIEMVSSILRVLPLEMLNNIWALLL